MTNLWITFFSHLFILNLSYDSTIIAIKRGVCSIRERYYFYSSCWHDNTKRCRNNFNTFESYSYWIKELITSQAVLVIPIQLPKNLRLTNKHGLEPNAQSVTKHPIIAAISVITFLNNYFFILFLYYLPFFNIEEKGLHKVRNFTLPHRWSTISANCFTSLFGMVKGGSNLLNHILLMLFILN